MVEILFCLMSSLENCLISTYLLWFSTRVQMDKNWGDTPSATLKFAVYWWKFYQYWIRSGFIIMVWKNVNLYEIKGTFWKLSSLLAQYCMFTIKSSHHRCPGWWSDYDGAMIRYRDCATYLSIIYLASLWLKNWDIG